jgi:hypothetical protein
MATFKSTDSWVPTDTGLYTLAEEKSPANTITCLAGGEEMLRVGPDGFWVRGKKVPQDDREAQIVYNAMKEFLMWSQLTRR